MLNLLRDNWREMLAQVVGSARHELVIASPFMTRDGANFVLSHLHPEFRSLGRLDIVTNLTPLNMVQGSTDPEAVLTFMQQHPQVTIYHLPRLHAKVYASDYGGAIVTSGNLTNGGLRQNVEYGIHIADEPTALLVRTDILEYAGLGAVVGADQLVSYCAAADEAKAAFQQQQRTASVVARRRFEEALEYATVELIRLRLAGESNNAIFARTLIYLLRQHRSLTTPQMHMLVQQLHPDLCDDSIDRVIDGRHYGKKWKHAVRSAQQDLKRTGQIALVDGAWELARH